MYYMVDWTDLQTGKDYLDWAVKLLKSEQEKVIDYSMKEVWLLLAHQTTSYPIHIHMYTWKVNCWKAMAGCIGY